MRRSAEHGFTLIELLIGLFIFGLIAAAGVGLLVVSIRSQAATAQCLGDLANERRISALLSTDLAQIVPRPSRDRSGAARPAFSGGDGDVLMAYVRGGWANSSNVPRSALQRVQWQIVQQRLERVVEPFVDGTVPSAPSILATDITNATIRFKQKGVWQSEWTTPEPQTLPEAVELTLTRRGRTISRRFLAGTGY